MNELPFDATTADLEILYVEPEVWLDNPMVQLVIADGVLVIASNRSMPSWWCRFWQRFLLGWRWEELERE